MRHRKMCMCPGCLQDNSQFVTRKIIGLHLRDIIPSRDACRPKRAACEPASHPGKCSSPPPRLTLSAAPPITGSHTQHLAVKHQRSPGDPAWIECALQRLEGQSAVICPLARTTFNVHSSLKTKSSLPRDPPPQSLSLPPPLLVGAHPDLMIRWIRLLTSIYLLAHPPPP